MMLWLWQSSLLLTLVIVPLLLLHPWLLQRLGARSCYLLWSAVPLTLLLPLLPGIQLAQTQQPALIETLQINAGQLQQVVQASTGTTVLFWLWLAGVVLLASACLSCHWQLHRQLRTGRQRHYRQLHRQLRTGRQRHYRQLRCYLSHHNLGPAIFGVLAPSLILPADFRQRFNNAQRRLILEHELAHWQRGDLHANLLAVALLCLFWFHPVIWLAYRRYRADQELACDAEVLQRHPKSTPFCYANALLAAMQSVPTPSVQLQPFCHHYGVTKTMKERLQQLKQQHGYSKTPALLLFTVLVTGSLLWQQPLLADSTATQSKGPAPVVRIEPRYPLQAAQNRIEGFVQLQFNIASDGRPIDIQVLHAQPENVFEKESIRALERWRYQPSSDASANQGLKVQLTFTLDHDPEQDMETLVVKPATTN